MTIFVTKSDVAMFFILIVMLFTEVFIGRLLSYTLYLRNREWYDKIARHIKGIPNPSIFAFVWVIIYILLVISMFIYYRNEVFPNIQGYAIDTISILFILNIMVNKSYTYILFESKKTVLACLFILFIIVSGIVIIIIFGINNKWVEFGLFVPYVIWSIYALYLNISFIYYENKIDIVSTIPK